MAWDLEGLIADLLLHISCAGEQGCPVSALVEAICQKLEAKSQHDAHVGHDPHNASKEKLDQHTDLAAESTVWGWVMRRPDVSLGPNRKYNGLTLQEILDLAAQEPAASLDIGSVHQDLGVSRHAQGAQKTATIHTLRFPEDMRVFVSEETMWRYITGHSVDHKRVPRLEWILLLSIASTKAEGILQGDLGRLANQDKRSVPKRTDALVKKGYIIKRTTLVRGTKTSKMWLAILGPELAQEGEDASMPSVAGVDLSHEFLTANLEPVPWMDRWTGEFVDYVALATTLTAIAKAWGTIRILDLKAKLGVLGMRWQMRVLSRTCRFLSGQGIIQYVAAKLDAKVFKDCIRFVRDLDTHDWSIYLATGSRRSHELRNQSIESAMLDASRFILATRSRWSLDEPISQYIARVARSVDDIGVTNPDIYPLTLGPSFSRFISTITATMAGSNVQPENLKHLQLSSRHIRDGKVAGFRYFMPPVNTGSTPLKDSNPAEEALPSHGFAPDLPKEALCGSSTLSNLQASLVAKGKRDRSRGNGTTRSGNVRGKDDEISIVRIHQALEDLEDEIPVVKQSKVTAKSDLVVTLKAATGKLENALAVDPEPSGHSSDIDRALCTEDNARTSDMVSMDASSSDSKETPNGQRRLFLGQGDAKGTIPEKSPTTKDVIEVFHDGLIDSSSSETDRESLLASTLGSGRSRVQNPGTNREEKQGAHRGGARGKNGGRRGGSQAPRRGPWVCEKCGGTWKNDVGLKYHLEKSNTVCNPSHVPKIARRSRLQAALENTRSNHQQRAEGGGVQRDDHVEVANRDKKASTPHNTRMTRNSKRQEVLEGVGRLCESARNCLVPHYSTRVSGPRGSRVQRPESSGSRVTGLVGQGKLIPVGEAKTSTIVDLIRHGDDAPQIIEEAHSHRGTPTKFARVLKDESKDDNDRASGLVADTIIKADAAQPAATPYPEEPLLSNHQLESPSPSQALSRKALTRNERRGQIGSLISTIVSQHDGVFPGGEALWRKLRLAWMSTCSAEAPPTNRECQAALRSLSGRKVVCDNWHSFRSRSGLFAKCQIITSPDIEAFCPQVLELLEKMKAEHPKVYIPDGPPTSQGLDLTSNGDVACGRRALPDEVAVLSAPVYTAQIASKRGTDESGQEVHQRRRKRRRTAEASTAPPGHKFMHEQWIEGKSLDDSWPPISPGAEDDAARPLRFLDPNTYMESEPLSPSAKQLSETERPAERTSKKVKSRSKKVSEHEEPLQTTGFAPLHHISQTDVGCWPNLGVRFFEDHPHSMALNGWIPGSEWFDWDNMRHEINRRRILRTPSSRKLVDRFTDALRACVAVEKQWADTFMQAGAGSAGPYNIFIVFLGDQIPGLRENASLVWENEGQHSIEHPPTGFDNPSSSDTSWSEGEDAVAEVAAAPRTVSSEIVRSMTAPTKTALTRTGPAKIAPAKIGDRDDVLKREREKNTVYRQSRSSKRIELARRRLTTIPDNARGRFSGSTEASGQAQYIGNQEKVLAAIIAIRALLGGVDRSIDWGLLVQLFPDIGLGSLRQFWISARKTQSVHISNFMERFYSSFLDACENDEVSMPNYDDPLDYDWDTLINWTMKISGQENVFLPTTQEQLEERYEWGHTDAAKDDWRERFFHPHTSTHSRLEAAAAQPATLVNHGTARPTLPSRIEVARSWIRSLCCTSESSHPPERVRDELRKLDSHRPSHAGSLVKTAIEQLVDEKVIHKTKRSILGRRSWQLTEYYVSQLAKLANWPKYEEAAMLKSQLDGVFRKGKTLKIPYTVSDGAMMALINMYAFGRIKLAAVDVPNIPFGFEPGNYESRKISKSYYHFNVEAVPTDTYEYNDDIDALKAVVAEDVPCQGPESYKPQWVGLFGEKRLERWCEIIAAVCFAYSTRGPMSVDVLCSTLQPLLERFEACMIFDWGKRTGMLKEAHGNCITIGEWWWLAVPWQRRQM